MVCLKEVLNLTKPNDCSTLWLRRAGTRRCGIAYDSKPMTLKEVRERLDMKAVMVHEIKPKFLCNDYGGMEYVVTGPGFDKDE